MTKYVIITGGVVSSIGKGITSASIGRLLKHNGLNVGAIKIDPYLNYDSGTLNPYQHGEVFVTYDGTETDLDIGHYERFLNTELSGNCNITTGKIYKQVIDKERNGDYLGECVQVIPHITSTVKNWIKKVGTEYDLMMVELGGTVGDIESEPYLEALRQLGNELNNDTCFVHVSYVPFLESSFEYKTKPTQHSVKELRRVGIVPDLIVARSKEELDTSITDKIGLTCGCDNIVNLPNTDNVYNIPAYLKDVNVDDIICNVLGVNLQQLRLDNKREGKVDVPLSFNTRNVDDVVTIAIVGKYVEYPDAYISIREALSHACNKYNKALNIRYVDSEYYSDNQLFNVDGVLVPGGFGGRGVQGKLDAIQYARCMNIPVFGICLGMQLMVVQFARDNGFFGAHSTEFNKDTPYPVINLMEEQNKIKGLGGTMRLGNFGCDLIEGTLSHRLYGVSNIHERHRHRYEVNNELLGELVGAGLTVAGRNNVNGGLVEIIEDNSLDWFVGCQFHPEYKSRPDNPHPLFLGFVGCCVDVHNRREYERRLVKH